MAPTTEPTVEERTIAALIAYAFPRNDIAYAWRRAAQISRGDAEVEAHLKMVLSYAELRLV